MCCEHDNIALQNQITQVKNTANYARDNNEIKKEHSKFKKIKEKTIDERSKDVVLLSREIYHRLSEGETVPFEYYTMKLHYLNTNKLTMKVRKNAKFEK